MLNKGRMGMKSNGAATVIHPNAPHLFRARAVGLAVRDYQNLILVKENGLRFHDEMAGQRDYDYLAAALAWTGDPKKMNGGGPIWAIFDADAVAREKWQVKPPYVDPEGYFFSADTIEELAKKIVNEYQWRPMPPATLRATVERYNSFVDAGADADFKKPKPMHKIAKPPFYAAWHTPCIHDTYTGIRINTKAQVVDLRGKVIPGLYACGDSAGGFGQHGICRAATFGRIAGFDAAGAGRLTRSRVSVGNQAEPRTPSPLPACGERSDRASDPGEGDLPQNQVRRLPLTPTLSPLERGEGAHCRRGRRFR